MERVGGIETAVGACVGAAVLALMVPGPEMSTTRTKEPAEP